MSEVQPTPLIKCRICKVKWGASHFDMHPRRPKQMLKACRICHSQHKCQACEKGFSTKAKVARHYKTVHMKIRSEKKLKCKLCEFKCPIPSGLKNHTKEVHDKIKNYQCPTCEFKFARKSKLIQHIKEVHDKIKNYQCELCEYRCTQKGNLTRHIRTCTGGRIGSSGEVAIKIALEAMRIEYEYNTSYEVKDTNFLRWDFIIKHEDTMVFIEYDGKQHFKPATFGGCTEEQAQASFIKQQQHDKMKNDYCTENKYALLRIPHYDFGLIPQILTKFMIDNIGWGAEHKEPDE